MLSSSQIYQLGRLLEKDIQYYNDLVKQFPENETLQEIAKENTEFNNHIIKELRTMLEDELDKSVLSTKKLIELSPSNSFYKELLESEIDFKNKTIKAFEDNFMVTKL